MEPIETSPAGTWIRSGRRPPGSSGFTLLELLVVLAIVALLATAVASRLRPAYSAARVADVVERIAFLDQQMRYHARRYACPGELVCDAQRNEVYVEFKGDGVPRFRFPAPGGVRVDGLWREGQEVSSSWPRIPATARGQTPSYAVRLSPAGRGQRWLFFSGVTGQLTLFETEADVQKVFQLLDQRGPDAD